jgi:hypothetical protein
MFTEGLKNLISFLFSFSLVSNLPEVKLIFYGSSLSDNVKITVNNLADISTLPLTKFDASKATEIFIHGSFEGVGGEGPDTVISAYLAKKADLNINVVLVDYGFYVDVIRISSVLLRYNSIPNTACTILDELVIRKGLQIDRTHLVSYSHGTFVAGKIGRRFKEERNISFPRITGLDPAFFYGVFKGPFFLSNIEPLSRSDADFVDVVHTDNPAILESVNIHGHVDFWPNAGWLQPSCGNYDLKKPVDSIACSHFRSWRYYAESIGNPTAFLAKQCSSTTYDAASCQGPTTAFMGYYASSSIPGITQSSTLNFYLATNGASPFSKS